MSGFLTIVLSLFTHTIFGTKKIRAENKKSGPKRDYISGLERAGKEGWGKSVFSFSDIF